MSGTNALHERNHGGEDHPVPCRTRQLSSPSPIVLRCSPWEGRPFRSCRAFAFFQGPFGGPLAFLGGFPCLCGEPPLVSTLRVRGCAASRRSGPRLRPWAYADRPVREVPGPGGEGMCCASFSFRGFASALRFPCVPCGPLCRLYPGAPLSKVYPPTFWHLFSWLVSCPNA